MAANINDIMLFRRRKPAGFLDGVKGLLWPRKGFLRPFHYFRMRVLRLTASPHAVAAGVAAGVISSWTPFMGFHFILAFLIAYLVAGNMVAAALGTAFGNPLTFPFIWASTWEVGHMILGHGHRGGGGRLDLFRMFEHRDFFALWDPVLKPMLIGAIPLGVVSGVAIYVATYYAVRGFQSRRRQRLAERAKARMAGGVGNVQSV